MKRARSPIPLAGYLRRRTRRRWYVSLVTVLLLLALAWADRRGLVWHEGSDLARYHGQWFLVTHVVDGDTLDVLMPDGDRPHTRVRLWGIDAPETAKPQFQQEGQPYALEASERLRALSLHGRARLWLEPSRLRDRYGRLLAHVELADETFVNETLLLEGLAHFDDRWPHGREHRYRLMEEQARRDRVGIWSRASHTAAERIAEDAATK